MVFIEADFLKKLIPLLFFLILAFTAGLDSGNLASIFLRLLFSFRAIIL